MTNTLNFKVINESQLLEPASKILQLTTASRIFCLFGELGAGKTTLVKSILNALRIDGQVSSPTYSLINEYRNEEQTIYHMDLYRLKNINEALEIGIEEYLYSGNLCFIEWPEIIVPLLPKKVVNIYLEMLDTGERMIKVNKSE